MQPTDTTDTESDGGEQALRLRTLHDGGRAVVEAAGEVDLSTADLLRPLLLQTCEAAAGDGAGDGAAPPCVVLDLRRVTFLDSAGMGLLVQVRRQFAGRCELVLAATEGGHPERALRLARLERVFRIVRSPDAPDL